MQFLGLQPIKTRRKLADLKFLKSLLNYAKNGHIDPRIFLSKLNFLVSH